MRARMLLVVSGALSLLMLLGGVASAATEISGEVGKRVVPHGERSSLRYVGGEKSASTYQAASPRVQTEPESSPTVMTGTIDLSKRKKEVVAFIGLYDQMVVDDGDAEYQDGASIYIYAMRSGGVIVGVTDGNANGELVQQRVVLDAATVDADPTIDVIFEVDGTVTPTPGKSGTCPGMAAADVATADGCMTLEVGSEALVARRLTDSYGSITGVPAIEFGAGAIAGWDAYPTTAVTGITYQLTVDEVAGS